MRSAISLLLCLLLMAGCVPVRKPAGLIGEFEQIDLDSAPANVQALHDAMKAMPDLYVWREGNDTYLLLQAGRVEPPGYQLEVLEVSQPIGERGRVRVLARLWRGQEASEYPHAVIRFEAPANLTYVARLSQPSGQVIELLGVPVSDR